MERRKTFGSDGNQRAELKAEWEEREGRTPAIRVIGGSNCVEEFGH